MSQTSPPTRGRPTTLDHDSVLHVSLMQYWEHDPLRVLINHICKLTGASKPAIYRAFGSDDALKARVLDVYEQVAIAPLLNIFKASQTFDAAIDFMTQDREKAESASGAISKRCFELG